MTLKKENGNGNGHRQSWTLTREKILMWSGLSLIGATFIAWILVRELRLEFLFTGLTLCGIGIAQWGDRKER